MKYFTSDWHLSHTNIIKFCGRPFKHAREMNRVLLENACKVLKEDDELYILGDVMMAKEPTVLEKFIEPIPCEKYLVLGNHDRMSAFTYLEHGGIMSVHTALEVDLENEHRTEKRSVRCVHDPAFVQDGKGIVICGHVHNNWISIFPNSLFINVGVDVWDFEPVSEETLLMIIRHQIMLKNKESLKPPFEGEKIYR